MKPRLMEKRSAEHKSVAEFTPLQIHTYGC